MLIQRAVGFAFISSLFTKLCICATVTKVTDVTKDGSNNFRANTAAIINYFGYPSEPHYVTTEDGYILLMHRIRHDNVIISFNTLPEKPVVLLMHGITSSSQTFVNFGPDLSIAYHLVDAGFEVWIGNSRGNVNSRNHTTLDPDHDEEKFEFFDFSYEDIGLYDVPAMVDYILEVTGRDRLHYIGHSQGGTAFLVLNSMRPEYNAKFASAHLLAGVGYMEYFPDEEMVSIAANVDTIYQLALSQGLVELVPESAATYDYIRRGDNCAANITLRYMCDLIGVTRLMERYTIEELIGVSGGSGGASVKQYAHFGQNIRDKLFRRWDYGTIQNNQIYGTQNPPSYDLSRITVFTVLHYGLADILLDERDVLAMEADMRNAISRKVSRDTFDHNEYLYAADAKELVTDFIIESMFERESIFEEFEDIVTETTTETTTLQLNSAGRICFDINIILAIILNIHLFK